MPLSRISIAGLFKLSIGLYGFRRKGRKSEREREKASERGGGVSKRERERESQVERKSERERGGE